MTRLYVNNFSTTISSVLSDASTTVELASVAGLPTISESDYMIFTISDSLEDPVNVEIVKATKRTGSVFTIIRGQEGTTPAAFSVGAAIEVRSTADSYNNIPTLSDDFAPTALSFLASDSKNIGGIGHDLRHYQADNNGLHPFTDAARQNPLGVDGWPVYDAIQQTYPGTITTAATRRIPDDWEDVLYIIPFYGQSLAGGANDNPSDVIINGTPTYPEQALMPLVGNKPDGEDFDTLQPMYEYDGTGYDSNKESPLTSMANTMIEDLLAKTGAEPKIAMFMASRGSRTWPQIGPGTAAWNILTKGILGCCKAARAMGLRPVVPAVMYLQGEQDRAIGANVENIKRNRLNMAREVNRAAKLITGQTDDVVVFVSQPNNSLSTDGAVPQHMIAPLELDGRENIRMLPPHYQYTIPSNVHPDSASYVIMGEKLADAVLDECFGAGYAPLKVVKHKWVSSTSVDLYYSAKAPLVIDTSGSVVTVPTWANSLYGFQFFDESGSTPAISSVTTQTDPTIESDLDQNQNIIRVTLASAPTGKSRRIHYATRNDGTGANAGNATGARGCIRDTNMNWANSQVIDV